MSDQPPSDLSQNVDQIDQIIDQAATREENAFLNFMRIYQLSNPKPNYEAFARWGTVSILCLMLTAASATGIAFASFSANGAGQVLPRRAERLSDVHCRSDCLRVCAGRGGIHCGHRNAVWNWQGNERCGPHPGYRRFPAPVRQRGGRAVPKIL